MKKMIIYTFIFTFLYFIFKYNNIVLSSIINGANIWFYKVFPYLFVMIIINDILINSNIINYIKSPVIYIIIMSILSGTPSNAYIIGNLYKNNSISSNDANIILLFTYFSNPLFLWTILNNIYNNKYISLKIILIHYLSNIIIFLIYYKKLDNNQSNFSNNNINLSQSIKKAIDNNMIVLGTICFYFVISNLIINIFHPNLLISTVISGLLEMTQGLNSLITYNGFGKSILSILFISFGGLSIQSQVKSILDTYNLNYKYYLKGRLLQTIISIIIITLL